MFANTRILFCAAVLLTSIVHAQASMSGPQITREEFARRLDELSFPWPLAAKVGVNKSLLQFEWFEDLKALQDQVGNPFPFVVFSVAAYDATGYFSVAVRDFPSIELRDFEMRCFLERLAGFRRAKETTILFYYEPTELRVFEVGRYLPSVTPDDMLTIMQANGHERAACAAH